MKLQRTLIGIGLIGTFLAAPLVLASPASAAEICEVSVIIHKQPGVILTGGRVGVETGEYEPYQDCI